MTPRSAKTLERVLKRRPGGESAEVTCDGEGGAHVSVVPVGSGSPTLFIIGPGPSVLLAALLGSYPELPG